MLPRGVLIAALVITLVAGTASAFDAQVSPDVIESAIYKTVHLFTPIRNSDNMARCSGSFVTSFGLILTNAHCVRNLETGALYNPEDDVSFVGVNIPGQVKPVIGLVARRLVDSPQIDIALLRVVGLLSRGRVGPLPSDFRVPFMRIADSDTVRIGEPIAVLGFPANGDDTITVTQGHVTGFTADEDNNKTWLKHDAATGHGASGGPIINPEGDQIAVTSWGKADPQNRTISYRSVLTNRIPMPWARYFQGGSGASTPLQSPSGGPDPQPAGLETGVVIRGRIVDADSGAAIVGALFVILRPGVSPANVKESDVLAGGRTDSNGSFQTQPPVPKGVTYPVAVLARGYQPIFDSLEIPANAPDLIVANRPIQLQEQ